MKLYYISQDVNRGYDTYDSAIVAADSEDEARAIRPGGLPKSRFFSDDWADPEDVRVSYIGEAAPRFTCGVILASFNAG